MGLDLSLLPFSHSFQHADSLAFSHSILECERRRDLFRVIMELPGVPVPDGFSSFYSIDDKYEEPHYGDTTTTPYGDRLLSVEVEALLALKGHEDVRDNYRNRAVWAYLAELPPDRQVALYWH